MTIRAILLGFLGVTIVCGLTYFNDAVIRQTFFVGNHMPFSVYGALVLFLILRHFIKGPISRWFNLSKKELAIILGMTLFSCCIPSSGLMRSFNNQLMLPHRYEKTNPSWDKAEVIKNTPKEMLADVSENENEVLDGFVQGLSEGSGHISPTQIPWYAWVRPFLFWIPVLLTFWAAIIALALIVHKQWAQHELLPYPIAGFASALLENGKKSGSSIFNNRLFWIGLLTVFAIHINNSLFYWFQDSWFLIKTGFNLDALQGHFPNFEAGGGAAMYNYSARIYFTALAVAFFLPADVSFSAGISPFFFYYFAGLLGSYGIAAQYGGPYAPSPNRFFVFGAFLGVFFFIIYSGKRYYLNTFAQSICLPVRAEADKSSVWGARVFILAILFFVAQAVAIGLPVLTTLAFCATSFILILVMGRVMAEAGIFFFQPMWYPVVILAGLFGPEAVGINNLLILMLLGGVLITDGRESLMGYVVNSLKVVDTTGMKIKRFAPWGWSALIVGLVVAIPITLYLQYDLGTNMFDGWAVVGPPRFAYDEYVVVKEKLISQDKLEVAENASGMDLLMSAKMNKPMVVAGSIGLLLTVGCILARIRFAKWPIHPVMFLVGNYFAGSQMGWSFLFGWLLRVLVMKYGGVGAYSKIRILMIGVIAGDMLGGFVPFLIGMIYYMFTKQSPPTFYIMPW